MIGFFEIGIAMVSDRRGDFATDDSLAEIALPETSLRFRRDEHETGVEIPDLGRNDLGLRFGVVATRFGVVVDLRK